MENKNDYLFIDTAPTLKDFCAALRGEPWLAVDTEFLRENTYYPKLCLIQIATPNQVACIDAQALLDLGPLLSLLFEPVITKVMHAARQDLEIFYHLRGALPRPVFDTQIAAPLLGYPEQAGYATLVEAMLGIHLSKSHTRADWSHRPLSPAQLQYAADDVRYLARLYPLLHGKLETLGRIAWLEEDFTNLTDPSEYDRPPQQAWLRIRGVQHLRGRRLAAAQALAAWREQTARDSDQPRNWVLKDDNLLDLAKMLPGDNTALLRVRGLNPQVIHKYGPTLLAVINQAQQHEPQPWPATERPGRLAPGQEAIVELLMTAARMIGERHDLNPAVIATRKELEQLVLGDKTVNVMQGWRYKLAGQFLQSVLRGETALHVTDNGVQAMDVN